MQTFRRTTVWAAGWLFVAIAIAGQSGAQSRFESDEALRAGMSGIRAAVINHHTLITHRRLPAAMARSFASGVQGSVSEIRSETAVPSKARAVLDPLLETIESSAKIIGAGGDSVRQMDALFALTRALETYGQAFDHPDWKPIQER